MAPYGPAAVLYAPIRTKTGPIRPYNAQALSYAAL